MGHQPEVAERHRHVLRAGRHAAAAVGAALVVSIAIAANTARIELQSHGPSHHPVERPAEARWLDGAKDVGLHTPKGVAVRGWQLPSTNGAAVLLVDGSDSDRTQLLPEARALATAGYGVLMFDRPGNGESGGEKLREDEYDFLRVALDALAGDPGARSLGALAFSSGAAFLTETASGDPRLRAVALEGCYADFPEFVLHYGGRGLLRGWSALLALEWDGYPLPHPLAAVRALAPRPLLFLAGDADPVVPWHSSEALYAAASEPKEIWIVPGAGHGHYEDAGGDAYARRLVAFFDRTLLERGTMR